MLKQLTAHGNSTALILNKAIMQLLGLTPGATVDLQIVDGGLLIKAAPDPKKKAIRKKINERYGTALKRLAE